MYTVTFVDNAKVMSKGQVTIPKDVRDVLKISNGDRVTFIVDGDNVRIVNSAVYAMQMFQKEMGSESSSDFVSEDDVNNIVSSLRSQNK